MKINLFLKPNSCCLYCLTIRNCCAVWVKWNPSGLEAALP